MENFREMARRFLEAGAAIQVSSPEELGDAWIELIQNVARRQEMGKIAQQLVERNRGATQRSLERIAELLEASRSRM